MVDKDGNPCPSNQHVLTIFDRALKRVKAEMKAQGREDDFIGAKVHILSAVTMHMYSCLTKVIYTCLRFITPEELEWYMDDCIELKKAFPDYIAGKSL